MKKFYSLTKTLLVLALLCVGANAWADDVYTTVYQKTYAEGDNQWAAADVTAWGSATNLAIDATTTYFGFAQTSTQNLNGSASYTISSIKDYAKVKYEVEWYVKSTNGGYGACYSYLKLGNLYIRVTDNWKKNDIGFSTDGGSSYCDDIQSNNTGSWVRNGNIVTVTAILNTADNTVESMSVVIDGTTYTKTNLTTTALSGANNKIIGLQSSTTRSGSSGSQLKSITVSQCEQEVTEADYTVNYQLNSTTVKTVSSKGTVGQVITADAAINGTEAGYEGNHYLITAASAPSMTLVAAAASNVLNVPVRAPYTATLNVTRTIGGVAETPVVTNLTETDAKVCSWNYTYPMYVQKNGVYYVADETASFGESGNFTDGQTINKTVAYTNPDYSVVYFGEPNEATGTNTSYSNGAVGFITGGVAYGDNRVIRLGQLAAGTYRLITNVTGDAGRNVVVGDYTAGTESFPTALVTITTTGAKDESFTVDGTQLISISGKDQGSGKFNQSATVDYILVKASSVPKTITAAGWATYCSPYALDFSGEIANLTDAYIVTGATGNVLNTTSVLGGTIPANTGILLKGEGEVVIPIVASSTTDVSANKLVGVTASTEKIAESIYVLMDEAAGVGFYKNNNAFTVGANTAYLNANFANAARSAYFFDGVTGVEAVEAATVAAKKDGKFFKDGKLFIFKNGKKFNANGAQIK